jgi:septal ring factor EnvC (AmiA/AmiB activator)
VVAEAHGLVVCERRYVQPCATVVCSVQWLTSLVGVAQEAKSISPEKLAKLEQTLLDSSEEHAALLASIGSKNEQLSDAIARKRHLEHENTKLELDIAAKEAEKATLEKQLPALQAKAKTRDTTHDERIQYVAMQPNAVRESD